MVKKIKLTLDDWEHLCSKINWSASCLDARAIRIMNNPVIIDEFGRQDTKLWKEAQRDLLVEQILPMFSVFENNVYNDDDIESIWCKLSDKAFNLEKELKNGDYSLLTNNQTKKENGK